MRMQNSITRAATNYKKTAVGMIIGVSIAAAGYIGTIEWMVQKAPFLAAHSWIGHVLMILGILVVVVTALRSAKASDKVALRLEALERSRLHPAVAAAIDLGAAATPLAPTRKSVQVASHLKVLATTPLALVEKDGDFTRIGFSIAVVNGNDLPVRLVWNRRPLLYAMNRMLEHTRVEGIEDWILPHTERRIRLFAKTQGDFAEEINRDLATGTLRSIDTDVLVLTVWDDAALGPLKLPDGVGLQRDGATWNIATTFARIVAHA